MQKRELQPKIFRKPVKVPLRMQMRLPNSMGGPDSKLQPRPHTVHGAQCKRQGKKSGTVNQVR